ncbi:radical SAM protein [Halorientalis brevis]|uniref:Radical SAM protein n=1 Tax=Halorientalis brevis TaxID=1126241 RepID=A0ABD6CIA6_9EURY|nr:radical SAM protein [Halorientalis brevis]
MRGSFDTDDRPLVLIWEVTQACDLACEHCRADARPGRHPDELTTAEGKSVLDAAARFDENQLVVLSGGDPCKRPDLTDLVAYGDDLGLRTSLTPSGTSSLTGDAIAALSDAGLRRMALSIDGGDAESHDAFRGEAGSFEETMRAAENARAANLPLQVNTTVCAQTVAQLPAIREVVREIGAVLWSVFFLVPVGRGQLLDPIGPDRADRVMEWLAEVADEEPFGVKTTEAPQFRRVKLQRRDAGPDAGLERRSGVVAGDGFAFVSHTGEIYPSGFLPKSAGTVREDDLVSVYRESSLFTALRDRDRLSGKCGQCEFRRVCGGSRSRAFAHTGDPLASDPLCPYEPDGYRPVSGD